MTSKRDPLSMVLNTMNSDQQCLLDRQALLEFRREVIRFLQDHYPIQIDRVGEPKVVGSFESGAYIPSDLDSDILLPFRYRSFGGAAAIRNMVFQALRTKFTPLGIDVRQQRMSICLRRLHGATTLAIYVLPGMEQTPGAYVDASLDERKKYLLLHDRESNGDRLTNPYRHHRLMRTQATHFDDVLRLLKAWRFKENFPVNTYVLELMVYKVATTKDSPPSGGPAELLRYFLQQIIPFLEADGTLKDIGANYPFRDFLSPALKVQLAARWKKILAAIADHEPRTLRSFFP